MPFELYYLRYKIHGAITCMILLMLLDTLMADGKTDEDEYIVMMLYSRCKNFCDDHGMPVENMEKSTKMRQKLLAALEQRAVKWAHIELRHRGPQWRTSPVTSGWRH